MTTIAIYCLLNRKIYSNNSNNITVRTVKSKSIRIRLGTFAYDYSAAAAAALIAKSQSVFRIVRAQCCSCYIAGKSTRQVNILLIFHRFAIIIPSLPHYDVPNTPIWRGYVLHKYLLRPIETSKLYSHSDTTTLYPRLNVDRLQSS